MAGSSWPLQKKHHLGFVLKHSISSELITAIREAMRGRTYITPMIAGELLSSYREGDSEPGDSLSQLTSRQREVLQLIAEGRSAKQSAALLNISPRTAEAHKAHILEALGLQSTADARPGAGTRPSFGT